MDQTQIDKIRAAANSSNYDRIHKALGEAREIGIEFKELMGASPQDYQSLYKWLSANHFVKDPRYSSKESLPHLPADTAIYMAVIHQLTNLDTSPSYNSFGAVINSLHEHIGLCRKLKKISIKKCDLMGLPASLANLSDLTHINLAKNKLRLFSSVLTKIPNLQDLDLSDNPIKKVTKSIGNMQNLKKLNLKGTELDKNEQAKIKELLPNCKIKF